MGKKTGSYVRGIQLLEDRNRELAEKIQRLAQRREDLTQQVVEKTDKRVDVAVT